VTRTPSITPTRTPSVTPSPSPAVNFSVSNTNGYAEISNVTSGGDQFYIIDSGAYPLQWNDILTGTGTTSSSVTVTISNFSIETGLGLYKNGSLQQCLSISGDGDYVFDPVSFNGTDNMSIRLEKAC
jgi:hypothetical protein